MHEDDREVEAPQARPVNFKLGIFLQQHQYSICSISRTYIMPIGPQLPPGLAPKASTPSDDEDDFGPALPPALAAKRALGPQLPGAVAGPSRVFDSPSPPRILRPAAPVIPDDDSDDEIGPKLDDIQDVPQRTAADEFREREARLAAKAAEPGEAPKIQRDDWMLAPPPTGALASLDPTKRPTTFQKSTRPAVSAKEQSVWTDTPAQRAQRERDELMGVKTDKDDEDVERRRKRQRDEEIREGVERHTVSHWEEFG